MMSRLKSLSAVSQPSSKKRPKQLFISLRWRLFPPLMLLVILMALTQGYFSVRQQAESTQLKQAAQSDSHQKNLDQLVNQYLIKLSGVGQYLDLLRQSQYGDMDLEQGLLKVLNESWLDTQLSFGFDGIAVFDQQQQLLFNQGVALNEQTINWLGLTNVLGQPLHTIACQSQCALVISIPQLLHGGAKEITLLVSVDLAVLVRDLAAIHDIDIILMASRASTPSDLNTLWELPILASSVPLSQSSFYHYIQRQTRLDDTLHGTQISTDQNTYWLRTLTIDSLDGELRAHLLIIDDISAETKITQRYLQNNILIMLGLVLAAITLAWLSLGSPLRRISQLANRLPMLARQDYRSFREQSGRQTIKVMDEVDRLQLTSFQLSYQLEEMQHELERRASEMQQMALTDPLTKLANRALFTAELERELAALDRSHSGLGVLFLDLDRFKNLNDTLGHQVGDQLLIEVARRLQRAVRKGDCVARNGGDEFTILLTQIKSQAALEAAIDTVFQCFETPIDLGSARWQVRTSIGATLEKDPLANANDVLKKADLAMYAAKQAGRSTYRIHTDSMQEELNYTVTLEQELRDALAHDEFLLHYQPIFNSSAARIMSAEALLRWNHPEKGLLPAGAFIDVLERSDLMRDVGYWVLESCIKTAKQLLNNGHGKVEIALNLASVQLLDEKLYDFLRTTLRQYDVPPSALEIEVTESLWMENLAFASEQINLLRKLGVSVSLDDFGTGYSSLSYLRNLPMDVIKIDRSFIADLEDNLTDQEIVHSIISLCRSLGKRVVVEGVETARQLSLLQQSSADYYQGYLLARPMPIEQFFELLDSINHRGDNPIKLAL